MHGVTCVSLELVSFMFHPARCSLTTTYVQDSVLTLSNELTDGKTAQKRCVRLGGVLANVSNPLVKRTLTSAANTKYAMGKLIKWKKYSKIINFSRRNHAFTHEKTQFLTVYFCWMNIKNSQSKSFLENLHTISSATKQKLISNGRYDFLKATFWQKFHGERALHAYY